jgi:putative hemolysin
MTLAAAAGWIIWPVVLVVSVWFDALFSGMETGMYVTHKVRLDLHAEAGRRPAVILQRMLADPRSLLAVLLIGTNVCRYLATFSVTALFVLAGYGDRAEWLTTAVATPGLFVLADSVPKAVFQRLGAAGTYRFAWLLRGSDALFRWTGLSLLVRGLSGALVYVTGSRAARREPPPPGIGALVAEGRASGLLTDFQSVMADRVARISDLTLADIMVPMSQAVTAPLDATRDDIRRVMAGHDYSHVPLLDDARRVHAVLDTYDVLLDEGGAAPRDLAAAPVILPAETTVTDALYQMQRQRAALAVVEQADAHVGIVTIKDLVEEIVGELEAL